MDTIEKKDALEEIRDKCAAYNTALEESDKAVASARAAVAAAKTALEDAADQVDATDFAAAKQRVAEAETALERAEMRKRHIAENGAVPEEEIKAAVSEYRSQIRALNTAACREIETTLEALALSVKAKNVEARNISMKLRELSTITGADIGEIPGICNGHYIWATGFIESPVRIAIVKDNYQDLHHFAQNV